MSFIKKPSLKDKIHCVVFVVDASKIHTYAKGLSNMFRQLRENLSTLGEAFITYISTYDFS